MVHPQDMSGHHYLIDNFKDSETFQEIRFYKMQGVDTAEVDGITSEEVLKVLIDRLNKLNEGKFRCRQNSLAIIKLEEALLWLNHRTAERVARGVEGTLEVLS